MYRQIYGWMDDLSVYLSVSLPVHLWEFASHPSPFRLSFSQFSFFDRQTDRQTDGCTDRQIYRCTDRCMDGLSVCLSVSLSLYLSILLSVRICFPSVTLLSPILSSIHCLDRQTDGQRDIQTDGRTVPLSVSLSVVDQFLLCWRLHKSSIHPMALEVVFGIKKAQKRFSDQSFASKCSKCSSTWYNGPCQWCIWNGSKRLQRNSSWFRLKPLQNSKSSQVGEIWKEIKKTKKMSPIWSF